MTGSQLRSLPVGISSAIRGVIDGGGNGAAGNGNPGQCTDITCR